MPLFRGPDERLIHIHTPRDSLAFRPNHSAGQLVKTYPHDLVTAQPQNELKPKCTGSVLLCANPLNGAIPHC